MEPAVKTGSLVFVIPSSLYRVGDIITFKSGTKTTTTHRLVAVSADKFRTAGDANNQPDPSLISAHQILGKVFYVTPYLGYIAAFAKTPPGFILFVIVPATIIIYEEIKTLFSLVPLSLLRRGVRGEVLSIKPLILIPIFSAAFILITVKSISYLSDIETSSNNSFTAFVTTPTPTPTSIPSPTTTPTPSPANHLVFSEIQIKGANANQDFVEIYNPTNSPVNLNGWSIRRKNSSCSDASLVSIPSGKSIPAHGFFLWSNDQGTFETDIGADVSNGNNISENYSLVLMMPDSTVVDQVAWGNCATPYGEGTPYPDINNDIKSIERKAYWNSVAADMVPLGAHELKGNGFDANNNSTDFISRTAISQPQNSSSSTETP